MSILGPLLAPRASIEDPAVPLTSSTLLDFLGIKPTAAGVRVTEEKSLAMPAVWAAVNIIAGTCASLPLHAYRRNDASREPLSSGQAATLLDNPHPDLVPYDFWELVHTQRLLWGNAYLRKLRNTGGQLVELWPIHPSRVKVGRETEAGVKVYAIDGGEDAGGQTLHDEQILHLPAFGYDGICGVSPIRIAAQGIGLSLAAEEYGARLFGSGSLASGILQTEQRLKPEQADQLHRRWKQKAAGIATAHDVVVLDSGVKFQQLTIPPEDAQFLESRRFQVAEIARMFGVPLHLLQEVEGSTSWGTGIAEQTLGFVIYTLRRWLIRTEQSVTRILKPEPVYAQYSLEGLLRGAPKDRADFYTKMWQLGVYSTNDIRKLEDMPPVEGGDTRYVALNYGRLGSDPNAEPEPAEMTDAERARAAAELAQKAYLAVDGNRLLTVAEGRDLLRRAGADITSTDDPFEAETEPAQDAVVPEQETADA